jgi:hypothetical protein
MAPRQNERRYTYDDYLTWPDEPRQEIFNGALYALSSPTVRHQELSVRPPPRMTACSSSSGMRTRA